MQEIRCKKCNKLLLKKNDKLDIEIQCPRCKHINIIKSSKESQSK